MSMLTAESLFFIKITALLLGRNRSFVGSMAFSIAVPDTAVVAQSVVVVSWV